MKLWKLMKQFLLLDDWQTLCLYKGSAGTNKALEEQNQTEAANDDGDQHRLQSLSLTAGLRWVWREGESKATC